MPAGAFAKFEAVGLAFVSRATCDLLVALSLEVRLNNQTIIRNHIAVNRGGNELFDNMAQLTHISRPRNRRKELSFPTNTT